MVSSGHSDSSYVGASLTLQSHKVTLSSASPSRRPFSAPSLGLARKAKDLAELWRRMVVVGAVSWLEEEDEGRRNGCE